MQITRYQFQKLVPCFVFFELPAKGRSGGNGILFTHNGMRRLYNIHKVNKKTIQHKYKTGPKKGQTKKIEVIAPAQWIAYVYTFTKDQFELFGNTPIKQGPRNFVIGSKVVSYKK